MLHVLMWPEMTAFCTILILFSRVTLNLLFPTNAPWDCRRLLCLVAICSPPTSTVARLLSLTYQLHWRY